VVVAVRIEDRGSFRAAADKLKSMDKSLARELTFVLRKQVQPLIVEQRAAVRALPVKGRSGSTGLRNKVARSVRLKAAVSRQPNLRIITAMAESKLAFAPRGLDTEFSGWRAPLFGDRHRWYQHKMRGPSWFMGPAERSQPRIQAAVIKTLNSTAEDIAAAAAAYRGR